MALELNVMSPIEASNPPWLKGAVLVDATDGSISAPQWLESRRQWLSGILATQGAVLLRGFARLAVKCLEEAVTVVSGAPPMPYENRSTPRKIVAGNIFTSTEYPASESIALHNENSYSSQWPMHIFFLCMKPADSGGQTPIADSRRVYASIPHRVRALFESKGVMYERNYGDLGLSWQETFQTQRREDLEEYCRSHHISWKWGSDGTLRTRQILPAVRLHPSTSEPVWFNQAHLFHFSSLGDVGSELVEIFGKDRMPRNALFGDGTEIEPDMLEQVRAAYNMHAVPVSWAENDLLILDNMLWAHGREPFSGSRRVLVAMAGMLQG
jgi:alpha-ketoglutarate-dependent taurine dioxygenase